MGGDMGVIEWIPVGPHEWEQPPCIGILLKLLYRWDRFNDEFQNFSFMKHFTSVTVFS